MGGEGVEDCVYMYVCIYVCVYALQKGRRTCVRCSRTAAWAPSFEDLEAADACAFFTLLETAVGGRRIFGFGGEERRKKREIETQRRAFLGRFSVTPPPPPKVSGVIFAGRV